jgi:serine/threonine protein kinase
MPQENVVHVCSKCFTEYAEAHGGVCPEDGARLRRIVLQVEDTMVGKVLDERYIVEEKIGQGGMGSVYRARQLSMDRVVAVKTMHEKGESADFIGRFLREANVASKLSHPNVVSIIDFGQTDDGVLFIVMELLEGEALADRLEGGEELTLEDALAMSDQMLSALSAAHDAQIVHRDLKPDNIFLIDVPGGDVFAKVLDFGIAKAMESSDAMTQTGQVFGTPAYMSPEQCNGDTALDARSDLYSLGCIIYELLSGTTPFQDDSLIKMMFRHIGEPVPRLIARSPRVEPGRYDELMTFLARLLAKAPAERFSDAMEARAALAEVRAGLTDTGLALPAWRQANEGEREASTVRMSFDDTMSPDEVAASLERGGEEAGEHDEQEEATAPPLPAPEPNAPTLHAGGVIGVAVAAALVILVAAFVFTRPDDPPEPEPEPVAEKVAPEPDAGAGAPDEPAGVVPPAPRAASPEVAVAVFAAGGGVRDALEEAAQSAERAAKPRAKKPRKPRDPNIFKSRSNKTIDRRLKAFSKRQARACVIKNHKARPDAFWPKGATTAKLRMVYGIDYEGEVVEATLTRQGSDFWDAAVNRCIEDAFRELKFHRSPNVTLGAREKVDRFAASFSFTEID